jgi:tetratricopeptide (TPR) repeat protein
MIAAFRAMYLDPPPEALPGGWSAPGVRGLGLFQLPETLIATGDDETLFDFARSAGFLRAQAEEFLNARTSRARADPLRTLGQALQQALRLDRVPEMAAFMLSRALFGARLAERTPLTALRAGHQELACAMAESRPEDQQAFWYLMMAWELRDAGATDAARRMLRHLLPRKLPLVGARAGGYFVILLQQAAAVSREDFVDLQRSLLDDNDRTDLCRGLAAAGQFELVLAVAADIRTFHHNRVSVLAEAARAAVAAGQRETACLAVAQATQTLPLIEANDKELAECLALIAGARAACGDLDGAGQAFSRALDIGRHLDDAGQIARIVTAEQASAGLLDDAGQTIALITGLIDHQEALETLAAAQARAGQAGAAICTLGRLDLDSYPDRPRALREVARALADAGQPCPAADLARRWLRPEDASALASVAVAVSAAGDARLALSIADSIADGGRRAQALVRICGTPAGSELAGATARAAVADLPDPGARAGLLAEFAGTRPEAERGPLFDEALRLAGSAQGEDRWQLFVTIGAEQFTAGQADAASTFATMRELIHDTQDWPADLRRAAEVQLRAGDTAGARQTLAGLSPELLAHPERCLKPITLARIAVSQAQSGDIDAARRACDLAVQHSAGADGEWLSFARGMIATAQAAIGDAADAAETVSDILATADEGDDQNIVSATVSQGVLAGVRVAREIARTGRRKKARRLLDEVTSAAQGQLGHSFLTYSDEIAELACALAELGKPNKALRVAEWDQSGTAADRARAAIAARRAEDGDIDGAVAVARAIQDPRTGARALGGAARALAGQESPAGRALARALLADAAREFGALPPAGQAVPALIEIGNVQASTGCAEDVSETLTAALVAASGIGRPADKDRALSQIAQSWVMHGDQARALDIAGQIGIPGIAGEALLTVALARIADNNRASAVTLIEGMDPDWQAIGLAVIAMARRDGPDGQPDLARVEALLNQAPEGGPRTRMRQYLIEIAVRSGNYAVAGQLAAAVTAGKSQVLSELADDLADRGAVAALKDLLADCAEDVLPAYTACLALARALPEQADAIVTEVAAAS